MKNERKSYINHSQFLNLGIAFYFAILISIILSSCEPSQSSLFSEMSSSHTNVTFKNLVRESEEFNVLTFGYFYNGGGVAIGDINNDGLPDIYCTGNMMASHLYLNQGDLKFKDIAESAGVKAEGLWNTGVTMVDVNADGWLDIYVCRSAAALGVRRTNQLFINNRNLTFSESSALYGLDDQGYSTQAAFLDYDRDGDLDMYLLNHSVQQYAGFSKNLKQYKNQENKIYGDRLYRNDLFVEGEEMIGRFFDVTAESGIQSSVLGFGLGVAVDDLNGDGWLDIYVSNDYNEEDYVYINQQNGSFKNEVRTMLDQTSLFSMGNDIADINNDGLADIISLDMLPEGHERIQMTSGSDNYQKKQQLYKTGFHKQSMRNMLQLNNGDGSFSEVGQLAGISNTDWSWASLIEDFDLDGDKDIFITNGYKADYTNMDFMSYAANEQIKNHQQKEVDVSKLISEIPSIDVSNYLFENEGSMQFKNMAHKSGLDDKHLSNGAAYADLDADGDLDLVVNNVNEKLSIYKNNTVEYGEKKSVKITIQGPKTNRFGIGAKVNLFNASNDMISSKTITLARGFQSSVDPVVLFAEEVMDYAKYISVIWSDGVHQINEIVPGKEYIIQYDASQHTTLVQSEQRSFSLAENPKQTFPYLHKENNFPDFDRQGLLPFKISDYGPRAATDDVNKDGLLDIYICATSKQEGQLFLQNKDGSFRNNHSLRIPSLAVQQRDASFFDADGDGDLDLYVTRENYTQTESTQFVGDKIFLKQNDGIFKEGEPVTDANQSHSIVRASDFDQDGDVDLFIGGFVKRDEFPNCSPSILLINDGMGHFQNRIDDWFIDAKQNQIVTDAQWFDYDVDGDEDLIIVGHWMPITIWQNEGDHFSVNEIENSSGLWNKINIVDANHDQYPDVVLGNYGKNSQLKADTSEVLKLYANDFDMNGTIDPIFCKTIKGKVYPFAFRDDLVKQIPTLKKKFNSYSNYANATVTEIFGKNLLANSDQRIVQTLATSILINKKTGSFDLKELNWEVQQSPVYAIANIDMNADGNVDLLFGGNQIGAMEQIGPNLSNKGTLLMGSGSGSFYTSGKGSSPLGIKGEVRDIIPIDNNKLIWLRNHDSLIVTRIVETKIK